MTHNAGLALPTWAGRPYLGRVYTLRLLGGIGVADENSRDVDALLRQTKHVALLAYLALPVPGDWHRRDVILGMFWPEHDQQRARSSLRSALYQLRRHFPEGAIRTRGDDEISVDPAIISTDVALLTDDFAAGRILEGLSRYRGDLLAGVYIADSPAFEKWLDRERGRLRHTARKAASALSEEAERSGDLTAAIDAAKLAAELDPDDEAAARRWIALLDRIGDRSQAFAVYERFRNHMSDTFGVRPSAETVALLDAVRTRSDVNTQSKPAPPNPVPAALPVAGAASPAPRFSRRWLAIPAAALVTAAVAAFWFPTRPASEPGTRSLVVLPMINETGDPGLAYVATGLAEGIAGRLEGIGGITIRSGARSDWIDSGGENLRIASARFGATLLLRSSIRKTGDSLEVKFTLADSMQSGERRVASHRFHLSQVRVAESRLAADIAGEVFRVPIPTAPRAPDRPVDLESYRLTLEGWHQIFLRRPGTGVAQRHIAAALFTRAIDIDPMNARAWSGLSSVWASLVVIDALPFREGYAKATAAASRALAIDSLQGTALANMAIMRAFEDGNTVAAMQLIRKAEAAEPSNPEVFLIKGLILSSAHLHDEALDASRVARRLDPLSPFFANTEGNRELCAGRPAAALEVHRSEIMMNPDNYLARDGATRALAMLGRYDEAIASWAESARIKRDTQLAKELRGARGRSGYWSVRHSEGRRRLEALRAQTDRVSPRALALAHFAAGDADRGFAELEKARLEGIPALYRLPCMPDIDEFRNTPRFVQALSRIGALETK
ncbi:MAG: BTAD domain-containing putative transcriptional regulator [Gemmatimonadaceae bacterium]